MRKTVYQTDLDGLYLYETYANELPLAPGAFNVPYGAVDVEPPAAPSGKVARWTDNAWSLVQDFRHVALFLVEGGQPYAAGTDVEIAGEEVKYLGWGPLPAWLTDVVPEPSDPIGATAPEAA